MHASERALLRAIFRRGSTTFYWTSRLFPQAIRNDVEALYAFVRIADDCVDELPADPERLTALEDAARTGDDASLSLEDQTVVRAFREICARHEFEPAWVAAFFSSMRADLAPRTYVTLEDTLTYIYGSAEVIGLMMARVLRAPRSAEDAAATLGRAFQYINMLRDVAVDLELGRTYLPQQELARHRLADLTEETARANPEAFASFMRAELARYRAWQETGLAGIAFLPLACRPAIRAACSAYARTAEVIERDPLSVYSGAYKPSRAYLLYRTLTSPLS